MLGCCHTLNSNLRLPGCRTAVNPGAVVILHRPLPPAYVPAGTLSKAPNGVFVGELESGANTPSGQLVHTVDWHVRPLFKA